MVRRFLTLSCLLLLLAAPLPQAAEISGRPLRLISGARLILQGSNGTPYQVKLAGIKSLPVNRKWGAAARRYLGTLIMGRPVTLEYRSGRPSDPLVGQLHQGGSNVNIRMLQAGVVIYDPVGLSENDQRRYSAAQQLAIDNRLGIWRDAAGRNQAGARSLPSGPVFRRSPE